MCYVNGNQSNEGGTRAILLHSVNNTVEYLLKEGTMKPAETAIARERLCKHVCY
jgi:hypothetical protein